MPIASDGNGNFLTLGADGSWAPATIAQNPQTGTKMINDGGDWKPLPGSDPTITGSALRGVVQGATFGLGDELRAGTDALVQGGKNLFGGGGPSMGDTYDASLAQSREQLARDAATHPVASVAGQVAGGVGGMLAGGEVAGAVGAGRLAAPLMGPVNGLASYLPEWLQTGLRLGGAGAAAGGLAGFGEGEGGLANRAESAATGAATGAVVGPAIGAVTSAAPAVVGRVAQGLGLRNADTAADRQIIRALDRGGTSVDQASTALTGAGDTPTALVDVGGRNVVNLGATAANTPSTAMDVADRFVQDRRMGRPDRLMNAGDAAFGGGSGTDVADIQAARAAQRTAEASPLYQSALNQPAGFTEPMQAMLADPIAQSGLARGLEIQRIENAARAGRGEPAAPTTDPAIQYDENGDPRIVGVPNMRSLDAVKRGMDAIIEDARDPTSGRIAWTERLRAIDDLRRTWVASLDQGNPDYAAARAAWGGPSSQMEATTAGRTALRTDRDVVAQRMQNAQPDVQDAYRLGAGRDFADRMSDPATASGAARKLLEDQQMQARLQSILPPDQFDALNTALNRETQMTAVERAVSPRAGSQTARLQAGGTDMQNDLMGPWLQAFRQVTMGHPMQAAGTVGTDVWRRFGQGMNSATSDALANKLFATDPVARQRVTDALRDRLTQDAAATERARAILRPAIRGVAATAGGMTGRDQN
jgi:hypothetical protein